MMGLDNAADTTPRSPRYTRPRRRSRGLSLLRGNQPYRGQRTIPGVHDALACLVVLQTQLLPNGASYLGRLASIFDDM